VHLLISVDDAWSEGDFLIYEESEPSQQNTVRFLVDGQELLAPQVPGYDVDSESMCALIQQAHKKKTALRIILQQGKLWQVKSRAMSLRIQEEEDVPLKDLLHHHDQRIAMREKWVLAVVLAHAALHCSNGPWLSEDWSKEHVSFFRDASGTSLDLRRPFLAVEFEDTRADGSASSTLFNTHSNPSLLSLGILLLEINKKKSIETMWSSDYLMDGQPNENTNLTTAMRLLQDDDGEWTDGYRTAVEACLEFSYPSLGVDECRKEMYEKIVYPLERDLENGFNIKPEDLELVY